MQRQVLESVVKQMNGGTEAFLGEATGEVPILRDQDRDIGETGGEHERLIASLGQIGLDHAAFTHDHDTIDRINPTIPTAEQGRALTHRHEQRRNLGRDGSLPAPTHRQRADTHDRLTEAAAHLGPCLIPPSTSFRQRSVDTTQHGITLRNGPKRSKIAFKIWRTRGKNVSDDLERLEPGALVRRDQGPGSGAKTGAANRVGQQRTQRVGKRSG